MDFTLSHQLWLFTFLVVIVALAALYFYYYQRSEKKQPSRNAYLEALKYMAEKDYRRAIEKFKEAVRTDSSNIDAYLKLGDILREEGLARNATRIHKDLTLRGNLSEEELQKVWYSLALDYWSAQKYDKAETFFKKAFDARYRTVEAVMYLVKIYTMRQNYKMAYEVLKNSPLKNDAKIQRRMALYKVMEALEENKGRESRMMMRDAIKIDESCSAAYAYIGDSYLKEDRLDDAINIWTEYCQKYPSKAHVLFSRLEKAWYEKGQFSKIEELYLSILKKDPENIPALMAITGFKRKKGDYEEALTLINDTQVAEQYEELIKAEEARIIFDKGQFKEAAKRMLDLLDNYLPEQTYLYACAKCGHKSEEPFWKCPKCHSLNLEI
ncbi:MAG TPA: tetratricopeptide repeat protein [Caldithrix abyssi]|uniref:Tetratricopeptide repeat protein n=1 Tax=Caldithrix abyssi TaxID=187145 RepID=A0A7V4WVV1_CALAY|nr:tetratricopeptide repeat protein [Caldithrix abyssi]